MIHRLHQFRRWAGVDRAVFFSNAGQITRLLTGPVTMVLVLKFLTPEIQGYFYAFAGVVAMQVFLEMGFSQNILQFASHEFAKLHFTPAKTVAGDAVARSRLISLGRLAFGYYAVAALVFFFGIGIGGHVFFTVAGQHGVHWQIAWWVIAASAAGSLAINPAWALLDGCNQIAANAQCRFWAAWASFGVNAVALMAGAGIYASAIGTAFTLLFSLGYFALRWKPFLIQFLERPQHGEVSWAKEIWPFQWRVAVSWMSGYFIFDIINPVAFYFCGPMEAGRLGMSFQLVRMISSVAMTWIATKAPKFGMLVAARAWAELDSLWRRSTVQAFFICLLGMVSFLAAVPFIGQLLPKVPARLAPFAVNAWLAEAMLVQTLVSAMAMELRAHKREPYMWLSVANAVLSVAFIFPLVRHGGIAGEAMGYALAIWAILFPAYFTFRAKRLEFRRDAERLYSSSAAVMATNPAANFS